MTSRIHKEDLPDYWELSPDARWQAYKEQQKSGRRKLTSWFLPIAACLPAIAFMTLKPVNDGVSLVVNTLGLMGSVASWAAPSDLEQSEQSAAVDDPKIMAFLDTIAWAEGTGDNYDIAYTFAKLPSLDKHSETIRCDETGSLCSDAEGRYQTLSTTWKSWAAAAGVTDFSPLSQDKAAIAGLKSAGVYDMILAGDIKGASCAVGKVWASFPCNDYGQGQKDAGQLEQIYQEKLAARNGQKTIGAVQPTIVTTGLKEWQVSLPQGTDNATSLVAIGLSKAFGLKVVEGGASTTSTPQSAVAASKTVFPIPNQTWSKAAKTSPFGDRINPVSGKAAMHWGQDFAAPQGTPTLATEAGTVLDVKFSESGCGNEIELQFADGKGARYCHLSAVHVEKGQKINAGGVIGEVGSTGDSTGPHLHFERIENGSSVDPTAYLESLGQVEPQSEPKVETQSESSGSGLKFNFEFSPDISEADRQVAQQAAAKLSAIIATDKTITVKVGSQLDEASEAWIAKAKPDIASLDPDGLPTAGTMILNSKYPLTVEPVEHELIHILGIGMIPNWFAAVDKETHTFKADTLAGKAYGGAIPLDDSSAHWSEEALKNELMTPFAESAGEMPIEAVTIAALKDLGWKIQGGS
jgi:murein DD-endopeptidase MepM/ murein hydrolase activator NlpD